ncbi:hypothetical protein [Thiocapsa sp.]|uniref:hypothetical protein n=1 Tax=Thiocapsa sp. TaxID=2024551 RepID=UPI0035945F6C
MTDATLAGPLDAGETLASAMEKRRLYCCNYTVLEGISVKPGRYLAHPIALFYVNGEGRLVPSPSSSSGVPRMGRSSRPKTIRGFGWW